MRKATRFNVLAGICLIGLCLLLAAAIITGGKAGDSRSAINKTLIGMNLTYSNIAGKPLNYTIAAADIVSAEPAVYNGSPAWKVRVGRGLAWDLVMDAGGTHILETKQLFYT